MTLKLRTKTDQLNELHRIVDTKRSEVKVDRHALFELLLDHSYMIGYLQAAGLYSEWSDEK